MHRALEATVLGARWYREGGPLACRHEGQRHQPLRAGGARISGVVDEEKHVFQWLLQETFDSKGNHILYEYAQDDPSDAPSQTYEENRSAAQRYVRRIFYGNLPGQLSLAHSDGSAIGILRQASDPWTPRERSAGAIRWR
jgi:hypothetical protein